MSEVGNLKWIEAGVLLAAGAAFGWWQLRDVKRAQAETRRRRAEAEAQAALGAQAQARGEAGDDGSPEADHDAGPHASPAQPPARAAASDRDGPR